MRLRIMDSTGDGRQEFNIDNASARREARALFERMKAEHPGGRWFTKDDGPAEKFEDLKEENVFVKSYAGG